MDVAVLTIRNLYRTSPKKLQKHKDLYEEQIRLQQLRAVDMWARIA
jgi:hypothetical protein